MTADVSDLSKRAARCVTHHAGCDCREYAQAWWIAGCLGVVREVARTRLSADGYCPFPRCRRAIWEQPDHTPACPVTQARELVARYEGKEAGEGDGP